ncbi:hypothetical protein [Pseudomonas sp. LAM2023]|uniref:hypothetical protein n=1 Tax=Pseudomonas sp. LAM2023 TaxID=2800477 RepID=UPI00190CD284|nr:hypothetical protein [Pseudomonas sp. LAM2023]
MYWFRRHRQSILYLTLAAWVLALAVMTIHGCLVQPNHDITAAHHAELHVGHAHDLHANGCLQNCEDVAAAIRPAAQMIQMMDPLHWPILLLLTSALVIVLGPAQKSSLAVLALKLPTPSKRPARLIFARLND